jgi:AAA+ ATPase superfamily predicted ATPase
VLERRIPATECNPKKKIGRYFIKDPALRFWFRYIFKNQSLIEIGDEEGLTQKIVNDLPTYMGWSFEELVRAILIGKNTGTVLPFKFSQIGSFWTRRGDVEIDIVALENEEGKDLFGECKLKGNRFTKGDFERLKQKAGSVKWRTGRRREVFALFSMDEVSEAHRRELEGAGALVYDLGGLLRRL